MPFVQRHHLSTDEKRVLDQVDVLARDFEALPHTPVEDLAEVARHLRAIEQIVAARVASRTDPERYAHPHAGRALPASPRRGRHEAASGPEA